MNIQDDYLQTTYSLREHTAERFLEDHRASYERRLNTLKSPKNDILHGLTILIPSCKKHKEATNILINELNRQNIKYLVDSRENVDLGTKRQDLYWSCNTEYALQWDADDWISGDFAICLSDYIRAYPGVDCINFLEHVVMGDQKTLTRRSLNFPWSGMRFPNGNYCFSPNTKSIVKTELAQKVIFEKGHQGEDLAFGRDLRQYLKSEINLDYIGYYYEYTSEGTATGTNEHQVRK
jgi:hypothetical protein